jgi:hypothetical protein
MAKLGNLEGFSNALLGLSRQLLKASNSAVKVECIPGPNEIRFFVDEAPLVESWTKRYSAQEDISVLSQTTSDLVCLVNRTRQTSELFRRVEEQYRYIGSLSRVVHFAVHHQDKVICDNLVFDDSDLSRQTQVLKFLQDEEPLSVLVADEHTVFIGFQMQGIIVKLFREKLEHLYQMTYYTIGTRHYTATDHRVVRMVLRDDFIVASCRK